MTMRTCCKWPAPLSARPSSGALRERLRPWAKVERKIAELLRRHGLRQGRYFGRAKTDLQAVLAATTMKTKRLVTLAVTPRTARAPRAALAR